MIPRRLVLTNFLAYRNPGEIRFDGIHLACLTGPNGAGKSSLLDAITWALWGAARARRDDDLIHLGQTDMQVEFDFEQEGVIYKVVRKRARGGGGTLRLSARLEDGWNEIGEATMRATQEKINRLLRLEYETFVDSAFLQQGKADSFTTKTPKERKQTLSDILGLDRWAQYETEVKERIKKLDDEASTIRGSLRELEQEIAREPAYQRELQEALQTQAEAEHAYALAAEQLKRVEEAVNQLKEANERKAAVERRLSDLQRDRQQIAADLERLDGRIAEQQAVIAARAEIEAGYQALQQARSADEELADKLRLLGGMNEQINQLRADLARIRADLEGEARAHQAALDELQRKIDAARPDEYQATVDEIDRLAPAEQELNALSARLEALAEEQTRLNTINRALDIEMREMKDRIERLERADGSALCPLCGQPLTEEHRLTLLDDLQTQGKQKGDAYRDNAARIQAIAAEVKAANQTRKQLEADLRRANQLRERASALRQGLDDAAAASVRRAAIEAQRAAILAQLDAESYGAELRERIARAEAERDALGYDEHRHADSRQKLKTYSQYSDRYTRLMLALDNLPGDEQMRAGLLERRQRLDQAEAVDRAELETLTAAIAELNVRAAEFYQRRQEMQTFHTRRMQAEQKVGAVRQMLAAVEQARLRTEQLQADLETLAERRAVYAELQKAFSKNGVPAMIIEAAIPELESGANRLLARMTDGRMRVTLPTQREKVTGGVAETLDIVISDELGQRSYELYSGGEAFRINFALRVALSQMLARRAGAHLRTLFIDEGFGTQDDDGRTKLIEAITAVRDDFDLILAITHIDELRDSFPVHIQVEKSRDGSRVSIR
jgi:exonuclease SbcC